MIPLRFDQVRSVLCVGCHADDIEIGCGGTLLHLLAAQALDVHWVVLSAEGVRGDESRRGAELFLKDARRSTVVVHDFPDSFFPYAGRELKDCIAGLKGEVSPDLIFTHRREDLHQDHRLVAELTWCAFRDHVILEYEVPKYEGDLGHPNLYVPLDEATCARKIESLCAAHASQSVKPWFAPDTFWALLRLRGLECNSPTRFAEGLYARKLVLG
jgi:LmbE family N-acetylglucosaminyl deacetylase